MAQTPVRPRTSAAKSAPAGRKKTPQGRIEIERDSGFQRFYADQLVALRRRSDTQLSFIITGPEPSAFAQRAPARAEGSSATLPVGLVAAAAEVARVYIPNDRLFNMTMQLFDEYITAQPEKASYVLKAITGLIELRGEEAKQSATADED